jgi:hypothetical protein
VGEGVDEDGGGEVLQRLDEEKVTNVVIVRRRCEGGRTYSLDERGEVVTGHAPLGLDRPLNRVFTVPQGGDAAVAVRAWVEGGGYMRQTGSLIRNCALIN